MPSNLSTSTGTSRSSPADRKVFAALRALAEGGPSLNGALAAADLLDELCLTLAPYVVSGNAKRIVTGPPSVPPPGLNLHTACEEDGYLFLRYRLHR